MTTYRYAVLVWRDHAGFFTAAPVEDLWLGYEAVEDLSAIGHSAAEALGQLTEYLTWKARKGTYLPEPRVHELSRKEYVVHVRPAYHVDRRSFPCDKSFRLRTECVLGKLDDQLYLASLPQYAVRLFSFEGDQPRELVTHHLAQMWKGRSPAELSKLLPPRMSFLDEVVVKVPTKVRADDRWKPPQRALESVAEALDGGRARRLFGVAWERDREVADLARRLGEEQANVILCGAGGAGKSTVLAEAVKRLTKGVPRSVPRRYWLTSAARLIAGMKYLGQWEQRCQAIIGELQQVDGVLCVENLLDLVRVGGTGAGDSVAAFLSTYLGAGELRMIAEATPTEIEACRRLLPGLVDLFQVLAVDDLDERRSIAVLERLADQKVRQRRGVEVARGVSDQIYHLFRRFMPEGAFPGRAASFLSELFDVVAKTGASTVDGPAVTDLFVHRTGLPEVFLRDELLLRPGEVFESLRAEVIGQNVACHVAADVVCTFKAGLNDPARPVAVLLFSGPTGVGKTQLARSLSAYCFGHGEERDRLIRLDMSEYGTFGAAARLIGSVSTGDSDLIRRVRQQPFVVLLLDEVEKAAPEVFDALLNLLDEGRLTDAYGRLTSFRSAIVIMTSNLGARTHDPVGFGAADGSGHVEAVERFFRPEFVNRIDQVVLFAPLSRASIRAITEKELGDLAAREGLDKRRLTLRWTDEVVNSLADEGYSARYGARNLQRTIERRVVVPLARLLLERPDISGAELRLILGAQGEVTFDSLDKLS